MMRRWICLLTAWTLLLTVWPVCQAEEVVSTTAEVVILLDQSESMTERQSPDSATTCAELATQWTQRLCMMLVGAPVRVRLILFDGNAWPLLQGEQKDIDMSDITPEDMEKILNHIEDDVKFNGAHTNHYNAISTASGDPENSSGRSYVMISDGKLDIDGDCEAAEKNFKDHCQTLAEKNKIYLLGLGTQLSMFQDLAGIDNITVMQNENTNLDELLRLLLAEVGYTLYPGESAQSASGDFSFRVGQSYEKTLVSITGTGASSAVKLSEQDKKSIKMRMGDSLEEATEVEVKPIQSGGSVFVYLSAPKQTKYFLKLPPGTWNCRVNHIKAVVLTGIDVALYDKDQEVPKDGEVYMVSNEAPQLSLRIKAFPPQEENAAGITITYTLESAGVISEPQEVSPTANRTGNGEWMQPLSLELNTEYTCQVQLAANGKPVSKTIQISTMCCPEVDITESKNVAIQVSSHPDLAELIPSDTKEISYQWDDTLLHAGQQIGNVSVDENGAVTFSQAGTYRLNVLAGEAMVAKVNFFIIDVPEELTWWEKIWNKICELFSRFCSLVEFD